MKKALILTDCSVDQAIALTNWLRNQPEPIDLTIVCAYALTPEPGHTMKATDHRAAKDKARQKLHNWLNFLPNADSVMYRINALSGNSKLVLQTYLLLRQYDYLLVNFWQQDVLAAFDSCNKLTGTKLRCLDVPTDELRNVAYAVDSFRSAVTA